MGLLTPSNKALATRADQLAHKATQYRTRAEQLDRDGKYTTANVARADADRYDRKAAKYRAKMT